MTEFRLFQLRVLGIAGVVGVDGNENTPSVWVESDAAAIRVRKVLHPSIAVVVTGKLWKEIVVEEIVLKEISSET